MNSDAAKIAEAFFRDSVSMAEIGRRYGLTRERIRQIVEQADPSGVRRKERLERIAQEEAEALFLKQEAELLRRAESATPCSVCGSWILRKVSLAENEMPRSCSPECAQMWNHGGLRYRIDPEEHAKHRISQARMYLRSPEKYPQYQVWALKMVGDNPPSPNRRYRWKESQTSKLVDSLR